MNRAHSRLPNWLLAPALIAAVLFLLPLLALLTEAPWRDLLPLLTSNETLQALALSVRCSLIAALLCLLLGLPLATWLAHGNGLLHTSVRVLVTLPMVLPPIVGGLALLKAFGGNGLLGGALVDWFGLDIPFTTSAVVLATTYVAMPFFVLTVEGGLRTFDRRYTEAAATLGAGPWRSFCTVTLPLVQPTLRAGLLLAWARALGEFGATITFAGSFAGRTRTLPIAVHHALDTNPPAAVALSLVLLLVSALVLFLLRHRWFPSR
ncbi:MAG TPA: molybdate ABC transporter permease subunit [bacterium]|nr:molybdate ABC transporter permease subunit [bacterium]